MTNKRSKEKNKDPFGLSGTGPYTKWWRIHGSGRPTVTSKMLLPIELDTAISPWPSRATITLEIKSGTDVPAAKKVTPITSWDNPNKSPMHVMNQTMKKEYTAIQTMERVKVTA